MSADFSNDDKTVIHVKKDNIKVKINETKIKLKLFSDPNTI